MTQSAPPGLIDFDMLEQGWLSDLRILYFNARCLGRENGSLVRGADAIRLCFSVDILG